MGRNAWRDMGSAPTEGPDGQPRVIGTDGARSGEAVRAADGWLWADGTPAALVGWQPMPDASIHGWNTSAVLVAAQAYDAALAEVNRLRVVFVEIDCQEPTGEPEPPDAPERRDRVHEELRKAVAAMWAAYGEVAAQVAKAQFGAGIVQGYIRAA